MALILTPRTVSSMVQEGLDRVKRFRLARLSHMKAYVGKYMAESQGITGDEPINLVFLAIRSVVPSIVQDGLSEVLTPVMAQREYAEKLGLALDELHRKTKQNRLLRECAVDACIGGLVVAKTSIAASGQLLTVADDIRVDPGQIYTERVSLDDFIVDANCTSFDKALFIGHRIRIERAKLMEAAGFNQDLVKRLPRAGTIRASEGRVKDISQDDSSVSDTTDAQDYVNIIELWVPEAEAICYLPDPDEAVSPDYLKIEEYYGAPSGPYSFGALTQPVPDNPFPIAPVGVWRDLSDMANRLFKKAMMQADRQKNITLYRPTCADVAEAIGDAEDGEKIASDDPDGVKVVSYEGPSPETIGMTNTLYGWFNLVAGNPDLLSGAGINSDRATGQNILQQNAGISISDMRDMVYEFASDISGKEAWYIHNDDLMFQPNGQSGFPLIRRLADNTERQEWLVPEDRTGEFDTLGFTIVRRAKSITDPVMRARALTQFTGQVVPQAFQAMIVALQVKQPFNVQKYLSRVALDMGISEVVDEIFVDPEFQSRMAWYAQTVGKDNKKLGGMNTTQNGQFPVGGSPMLGPTQQFNQDAQMGAAPGQAELPVHNMM